jgi:hypothetical protein
MGRHSVRKQTLCIGILACMVATGLNGCASSGLVNVWMDPQYTKKPMLNVLVIAIKPDIAKRRLWEDAFADAFRQRGVTATPSYRLFPNDLPDTNAIIAAVSENSYDGCIVTVKLPSDTLIQDVPGYTTDSLVVRYNPWKNRYYNYYTQVYRPGYTETHTVLRHRIEVWSTTGQGALVWTATSEVLDPTSHKGVNQHIIGRIVGDLAKQGVIPAKK